MIIIVVVVVIEQQQQQNDNKMNVEFKHRNKQHTDEIAPNNTNHFIVFYLKKKQSTKMTWNAKENCESILGWNCVMNRNRKQKPVHPTNRSSDGNVQATHKLLNYCDRI